MRKFSNMAFAMMMMLAGVASAQMATTEKSAEGAKSTTAEHAGKMVSEVEKAYVSRLEAAYRAAGVPESESKRLIAIDKEAHAAIREDIKEKIKSLHEQEVKILTPEQHEKVKAYLKEHPVMQHHVLSTYEKMKEEKQQ